MIITLIKIYILGRQHEIRRQTDRQTITQTDRQRDRQTDRVPCSALTLQLQIVCKYSQWQLPASDSYQPVTATKESTTTHIKPLTLSRSVSPQGLPRSSGRGLEVHPAEAALDAGLQEPEEPHAVSAVPQSVGVHPGVLVAPQPAQHPQGGHLLLSALRVPRNGEGSHLGPHSALD